ncbi:MAG: helix-turn-helix domain-containing protein [Catenulispora sp.]|nr:helix-turn-helix domain-containing protein [Catenulispora sp.]
MTHQDRQRIAAGLIEGLSYTEIGRRLDRPTSTVCREIARNGGPTGYRPEQAHRATQRRARRRIPTTAATPPAEQRDADVREAQDGVVEMAVDMGLPRMAARVLTSLWFSQNGRLTAAELARTLKVSPASVSTAVGYLGRHGLIRRERDPRHRRDVYVVDNDTWYQSAMTGARQTLEAARITTAHAQALGLDTPTGSRLAKAGAFLEQISLDTLRSVELRRALLS